jgi:hypothetical protein
MMRTLTDDQLLELATQVLPEDQRRAVDQERERRWRPRLKRLEKRIMDPGRKFWQRTKKEDPPPGTIMPAEPLHLPGAFLNRRD